MFVALLAFWITPASDTRLWANLAIGARHLGVDPGSPGAFGSPDRSSSRGSFGHAMLCMLCCAMRRNATTCYDMPSHTPLCNATLRYIIQQAKTLWKDIMCYHALRYAMPCHAILRLATLCTAAQ